MAVGYKENLVYIISVGFITRSDLVSYLENALTFTLRYAFQHNFTLVRTGHIQRCAHCRGPVSAKKTYL